MSQKKNTPSKSIGKTVYEAFVAVRTMKRTLRRKRAPQMKSMRPKQIQNLLRVLIS